MTSDSLAFATCLKCGRGFGGGDGENEDERSNMLVCAEVSCPNVIHEACLSSEREIDDAGKFFCLYCGYQRALARIEMLQREGAKSEEALSRFLSMSSEVDVVTASEKSRDEEDEEEENLSEDNASVGIDGGDEGTEERNLVDAVAPETGDFQGGSPLLLNKRYKRKAQRVSGCEVEDVVVENDEERSEKDRNDEKGDDESSKVRRSQCLNRHERGIPSEFNLTRVGGPKSNEKDTNYISAGSSAQPVKFEESGSKEIVFKITKRRRIPWTPEELKELKEGVEYFSMQVRQNLPWRKILDRGSHVFHESRTPDNLKDKWKVMCKEAEALNR